MKAIIADNLTKMFGHLVAVDHVSLGWIPASSQRWKLTEETGKMVEPALIWVWSTITGAMDGLFIFVE